MGGKFLIARKRSITKKIAQELAFHMRDAEDLGLDWSDEVQDRVWHRLVELLAQWVSTSTMDAGNHISRREWLSLAGVCDFTHHECFFDQAYNLIADNVTENAAAFLTYPHGRDDG